MGYKPQLTETERGFINGLCEKRLVLVQLQNECKHRAIASVATRQTTKTTESAKKSGETQRSLPQLLDKTPWKRPHFGNNFRSRTVV